MHNAFNRPPGKLLQILGIWFAIAVCIGSMIGGGILRTPGAVASRVPDPQLILLLWAAGGLHALLGANVLAELSTGLRKAGGLYVPARWAFGDFAGVLVGWSDWLLNVAAIAALAIASVEFLAIIAPAAFAYSKAIAALLLLGLYGLNWLGVREGSFFQKLGSALKFILLAFLIGTIFTLSPGAQVAPSYSIIVDHSSLASLIIAYQLVYGAFSGWPSPIYFVEEDPQAERNIPRAMSLSILAATVVYLLMNFALLQSVPLSHLRASELPVALAVVSVLGPESTTVVAAIALLVVLSCLNGLVMVVPRILYGLARDGLFLTTAQRVNAGGTPDFALALSAALSLFLVMTGTFETVFLLMGAITLFTLLINDVAFFVLRKKEPDLARPFRAIGYPILPLLLLLVDFSLLIAIIAVDPRSATYMFALIGLCLPLFAWVRRNNRETAKLVEER